MNNLVKGSSGSYSNRETIIGFERAAKNARSNNQGSITSIEKGKCFLRLACDVGIAPIQRIWIGNKNRSRIRCFWYIRSLYRNLGFCTHSGKTHDENHQDRSQYMFTHKTLILMLVFVI